MSMSAVKVPVASLFCAASVLYKLSLKKNPVALVVPEVWINAVFAMALLENAEIAFRVLMLGTSLCLWRQEFSHLPHSRLLER
jgi:hypothetical protein